MGFRTPKVGTTCLHSNTPLSSSSSCSHVLISILMTKALVRTFAAVSHNVGEHQLTWQEHPKLLSWTCDNRTTLKWSTTNKAGRLYPTFSKPMSSAVVLWVSITMNTVVLVCSGPRCAARRGRIVCLLISPSICKSPLQQAAPSDELRDTSRLSTPSHTSRVPEQQWGSPCLSLLIQRSLPDTFTRRTDRKNSHSRAHCSQKSVALGCKKAANKSTSTVG